MSDLKLCIDCKWYQKEYSVDLKMEAPCCTHIENSETDLVTGVIIHEFCAGSRFSGPCYEAGLLWEAKECQS